MKTARVSALVLALAVLGATTASWASAPGAAPAAVAVSTGEVAVKGKVDAVTVYRGQALVTRVVEMPAGQGLGEYVVSDLPEHIVASSIFAEGSDGVEVRSVRYRERPVAQDVRDEVRKLDDQIRIISDKIALNSKQTQVLGEQRAYLDKLAAFTAPTATTEMSKGVLNADQLKTLTNYQFETRQTIATDELKLQQEARDLQEQGNLLVRQRGEITGRSTKTAREAVIFINRERAGGALRLRYLVDNATWSPSYNVRADSDKKTASLEYLASIAQLSGEDWANVQMTLSTASPNLVAAAPTLASLEIELTSQIAGGSGGFGGGGRGGRGGPGGAVPDGIDFNGVDYGAVAGNITARLREAESNRNNGIIITGNNADISITEQRAQQYKNDQALARVADQRQVLELVTKDSKTEIKKGVNEGVVVTYALKSRTSLPSRSDRQLIQVDQLPMKGSFYKVAVPVLTSYVYDQAELTNTSNVVLLTGPVASYVGGEFVGSGTIDTVAVGQSFTVGLGIDSSLRATRERLDKTDLTQTGNRVVTYTYRLAVENFGTKPASVRLTDRVPVGKDADVHITFEDADNVKVSPDKEYQLTERKKGILRWDLEVPAQKNGSEALALSYKLKLEHDKNLAISTAGLLGPELNQLLQQ